MERPTRAGARTRISGRLATDREEAIDKQLFAETLRKSLHGVRREGKDRHKHQRIPQVCAANSVNRKSQAEVRWRTGLGFRL